MIFGDEDIEWSIFLSTNKDDDIVYVVIQVTEASSVDRAKQAATELASLFAAGREVYWRRRPEADEQKDFMYDKIIRKGYARFSFRPVPGEHHDPDLAITYPLHFGAPR